MFHRYLVVGPEHPLLEQLTAEDQKHAVSVSIAYLLNCFDSVIKVRICDGWH